MTNYQPLRIVERFDASRKNRQPIHKTCQSTQVWPYSFKPSGGVFSGGGDGGTFVHFRPTLISSKKGPTIILLNIVGNLIFSSWSLCGWHWSRVDHMGWLDSASELGFSSLNSPWLMDSMSTAGVAKSKLRSWASKNCWSISRLVSLLFPLPSSLSPDWPFLLEKLLWHFLELILGDL